jgi:hypothetical protein
MPLKRKRSISTDIRYKIKMYAVGLAKAVGNEMLAMEYADTLTRARIRGVRTFEIYRDKLAAFLENRGIPRGIWGIYFAFVNFFESKINQLGLWDLEAVYDHFAKLGADRSLLPEIVQKVFSPEKETAQPGVPATEQKPGKS